MVTLSPTAPMQEALICVVLVDEELELTTTCVPLLSVRLLDMLELLDEL
jgi:hypothetical protein